MYDMKAHPHFIDRLWERFGILIKPNTLESLFNLATTKGWEDHKDYPNRKIAFIRFNRKKLAVVFDHADSIFITAFPW